jgi:RNA recognition motif-containing protein
MLQDNEGKFKGAAFVEFDSSADAEKACKIDGKSFGDRRLRVNPAGNKPSGTRQ